MPLRCGRKACWYSRAMPGGFALAYSSTTRIRTRAYAHARTMGAKGQPSRDTSSDTENLLEVSMLQGIDKSVKL